MLDSKINFKITALFLVIIMMLSSVISYSENLLVDESLELLEDSKLQIENDFKDYDSGQSVEFIVKLSDNNRELMKLVNSIETPYRDLKRSIRPASLDELKSDRGIDIQREFTNITQSAALRDINNRDINYELTDNFEILMNGFVIETTYTDAKKISEMPYVEFVSEVTYYDYPETPYMNKSNELIESGAAWDLGYDGEGAVIAVIDSGIDPSHKDFKISPDTEMRWTKESMNNEIKSKGLRGKWYSDKVPYAYNYSESNHRITEEGENKSEHGQHVAGTVAANGDPHLGGIRGVAPEAQILGLRVFTEGEGTSSAIYVSAMEEAFLLGADAINMSLGGVNGNKDVDIATQTAIKKLGDLGTVVVIAAGNEGHFAYGHGKPKSNAPDYGLVGTPSTANDSLSVASYENTHTRVDQLELKDGSRIPYNKRSIAFDALGKTFEVLDAGIGEEKDFEGKDFTNKAALIERGELTFVEKINNAEKAGAKFVLIYNDPENGNELINMGVKGTNIPSCSILRDDAIKLINDKDSIVKVLEDSIEVENEKRGRMSDFSSWGVSTDFAFKPEITAPGGNIYSTLNEDEYGIMGGTSMAAPHVAGGTSILKQRINRDFPRLSGFEKRNLNKNLLMSTSKPIYSKDNGVQISPRKQGAGLMDLRSAMKGNVILYDLETKVSKINLGKNLGTDINFDVGIKNFSDNNYRYNAKLYVNTNEVDENILTLDSRKILEKDLGEIILNGMETKETKIEFDISEFDKEIYALMPNGYFVEGFLSLESLDEQNPNISIPFVGFRGNFDEIPILEKSIYDMDLTKEFPIYHNFEESDIHSTHLKTSTKGYNQEGEETKYYSILGLDKDGNYKNIKTRPDKIAISPNGDGIRDEVGFRGVFNRDATDFKISVYNSNNELVYHFNDHEDFIIEKNMFIGDVNQTRYPKSTGYKSWEWTPDGSIEDGKYIFEVSLKPAYGDGKVQKYTQEIIVDREMPRVSDVIFKESGNVIIEVEENISGVKYFEVLIPENGIDGEYVEVEPYEDGKYKLDLSQNRDIKEADIKIRITDWAYNTFESDLENIVKDSKFGSIRISSNIERVSNEQIEIDYLVKNKETNEIVDNLSRVEYGTYIVEPINLPLNIVLKEGDSFKKEITVDEENRDKIIEFNFIELEKKRVFIRVPSDYEEETGNIVKYLIRFEDGRELVHSRKDKDDIFTIVELPYGNFEIEIIELSDEWISIPQVLKYENSEESKNFIEIELRKKSDVGEILVKSLDEDGNEIKNSDIEYIAKKKYSEQIYTDLSALDFGVYTVSPKLDTIPKDTYLEEYTKEVRITEEDRIKEIEFKYLDSVGKEGKLTINNINNTGKDINMVYTLIDIYGEIVEKNRTEFDSLPYGEYKLVIGDERTKGFLGKASYFFEKEYIVRINDKNPNIVMDFEWYELKELDEKGFLRIDFKDRYEYDDEVIEIDIINIVTGEEVRVEQKLSEGSYSQRIELEYGDYIIRPINNKEDIHILPIESEVLVSTYLENFINLTIEEGEAPIIEEEVGSSFLDVTFMDKDEEVELEDISWYITDEQGRYIENGKIKIGKYYLNIEVPKGYRVLEDQDLSFVIEENNSTVKKIIKMGKEINTNPEEPENPDVSDSKIKIELVGEFRSFEGRYDILLKSDNIDNISLQRISDNEYYAEDLPSGIYTLELIIYDENWTTDKEIYEVYLTGNKPEYDYNRIIEVKFLNIEDIEDDEFGEINIIIQNINAISEEYEEDLVLISSSGKIIEASEIDRSLEPMVSYKYQDIKDDNYTIRFLTYIDDFILNIDGEEIGIIDNKKYGRFKTRYIDDAVSLDKLKNTFAKFDALNSEDYQEREYEEISNLIKTFIEEYDKLDLTQKYVDEFDFKIIRLMDKLEGKIQEIPLDLSKIEDLLRHVNLLDRNLYTEESLEDLDNIIRGIKSELGAVKKQEEVDSLETLLREAILNLIEKVEEAPLDLSKIENLLDNIKLLDREKYSKVSLKNLDNIIKEVKIKLEVVKSQEEVDNLELKLRDAISKLNKKIEEKPPVYPKEPDYPINPPLDIIEIPPISKPVKETKNVEGENGNDVSLIKKENNNELRNSHKFKDIKNIKWAVEAIETLYSKNIINGVTDYEFKPNNKIKRAEFIAMISRLYKLELGNFEFKFNDVFEEDWFYNDVEILASNGIIEGYGDNNFKPNENISREEAIKILVNTMEYKGLNLEKDNNISEFKDYEDISDWALESISKARSVGLIEGDNLGKFNPKNKLTRAESAVIIFRNLEIIER